MNTEPRREISLRQALKWGLAMTVITRVVFFAMGYGAMWLLAETRGGLQQGFFDVWLHWDAKHLMQIAVDGYFGPESDDVAAAFFPLFPLATRPLLWIGMSTAAAGMTISAIASVFAYAFLYRLTAEEYGDRAGTNALFYLALFPTSVFLLAPYTEALFLAGAIPAFYYARRQRWNMTILPAAIATGTRAAGIFVVAGLLFEFIRQKDFSLDRLIAAVRALLLALVPVAAYIGFLMREASGYSTFLVAQEAWHRSFTSPLEALTNTIDLAVFPEVETNFALIWRLEIVGVVLGLYFVGWAVVKREWGYTMYMGATLGMLMVSNYYLSVPRILLTFFPAMIFLAAWTRDRPVAHNIALLTLAPLASMGVIVFNSDKWFF